MIDNLKDINLDLYESYNNSLLMWKNRNKGVYFFVQQFIELLIKHIVKEDGKSSNLKTRSSLGGLLENSFVKDLLKYDFSFSEDDFNKLSEINKTGNKTKHDALNIQYLENNVQNYLVFNYKFAQNYLRIKKNIIIDDIPLKFFSREDETAFKQEVHQIKDSNLLNLIESNTKDINEIVLKNTELNNTINQINSSLNTDNNTLGFTELRSKLAFYINEIDRVNLELDESPDNVELTDELEDLNYNLEEVEKMLRDYKIKTQADRDVELQKTRALLEANNYKLNSLNNKKSNIERISKSSNDNVYDVFSDLLNNLKISFDSSYVEASNFTLSNFVDEDNCKSKYKSYFATILNQLIRGKSIRLSDYLASIDLSINELNKIYQIEVCLLLLIKTNKLNDSHWDINFTNSSLTYANLAIGDLFYRLRQLAILSDIDFIEPEFTLTNDDYNKNSINILFDVIYPNKSNCFSILKEYKDNNRVSIWITEKIKYTIKNEEKYTLVLERLLSEFFGFNKFRHGQIEILINTLNGNNTIGILTTSGGKSLIYQFASLMQPKITIVVDPIVSLINDQYNKIVNQFDITRVKKIISENSISPRNVIEQIYDDFPIVVFSTPERFQDALFRDWLIAQSINSNVGLIVLDEVHCLSEWGHDFRIAYLMLSHTINTYCSNFQYLGLTATAAINVIKDLQVELGIYEKENIVFSRKLQRDNLNFSIFNTKSYDDMNNFLTTLLERSYSNESYTFKLPNDDPNGMIVFFKETDTLLTKYGEFSSKYPNEIAFYYGDNKEQQDAFMNNNKTLLFSTKAFGMGIDKPNVSATVHFGMPASRESFFQEAGRAGRDGRSSECILLTFKPSNKNIIDYERFLNLTTDTKELIDLKKKISSRSDNDLSTIAHFMLKDIAVPEHEADSALSLLSLLKSKLQDGKCDYPVSSDDFHPTQVSLYILHKIGIIRTWTVKYNFSKNTRTLSIQFLPDFEDIEHIKQNAINYLTQYAPNRKLIDSIESIYDYIEIKKIIIIVREWYQATFLRSKREQLANMVDFIRRYQNAKKSDQIQDEMSLFFDITRLLEKRDSKTSLTFDGATIKKVIQRVNKVKKSELNDLRITMERLLETEESPNINIFTSLLMLKLDSFNSRNGRDRLFIALNNLDDKELIEFYKNLKGVYTNSSEVSKKQLLDFLYKYNEEYFMKYLFDEDYFDENISTYVISSINNRYNEIF